MRKFIYLLTILFLVIGLLPSLVFADTGDLTVASYAGGDPLYSGGAANYTVLNDDNGDTSYLYANQFDFSGTHHFTYNMADFATANNGISSVTVTYKIKTSGAGSTIHKAICSISGTEYYGTGYYNSYANYTEFTYTWKTNPASGNWTATAINNAVWGIYIDHGACEPRVTYLKLTVTYTPVSAPSVTTTSASVIAVTSATLNGTITDDGGATITNYGFVWGNESRANPGNVQPSGSAYDSNWIIGAGTYAEGVITRTTGATLLTGVTYYYRAAALNSVGWIYGDEISFTTIYIPIGETIAASNIAVTTARLNGHITNDGGQATDVQFGYDTSNHAAFADYPNKTTLESNTYSTGSYPFADIVGLTLGTTYHFRVQITNDAGVLLGDDLTFLTETGIDEPTNFTAISTATTISYSWVKGLGSSHTLVRYSTGGYPTTVGEGTLLYLNTSNSIQLTNLPEGTTIYASAWGMNGGIYSGDYAEVMVTTLAYSESPLSLPKPGTSDKWGQTPSSAKLSKFPFAAIVNMNLAEFEIPLDLGWYALAILFAIVAGIFVYNRGNKNLFLAMIVVIVCLGIGASVGLTDLWYGVIFGVVGTAISWFAGRYV